MPTGQHTKNEREKSAEATRAFKKDLEYSNWKRKAEHQKIDDKKAIKLHKRLVFFEILALDVLIGFFVVTIILYVVLLFKLCFDPSSVQKIITAIELVSSGMSLIIGGWGIKLSKQANRNPPSSNYSETSIKPEAKKAATDEKVNLDSIIKG